MLKLKKGQSFRTTIKLTKYTVKTICKDEFGKRYVWIKALLTPVFAIFPMVSVVIPGWIINELTGDQRFERLALYVALLVFVPFITNLINVVANRQLEKERLRVETRLQADLYLHMFALDYETVENPDVQIQQSRAAETTAEIMYVIDGVIDLVTALIKLAALISLIATLNPWIIAVILILVYLNSMVAKNVNIKKHLLNQECSKYGRSVYGTSMLFEDFRYSAEIRLYNLVDFFIERFKTKKAELDAIELKKILCADRSTLFSASTNCFQQLFVYVYVIYSVVRNGLPIGDMTIYISAVGQFSSAFSQVMKSYITLASRNMKIQEYIDLFNLQEKHVLGNRLPCFHQDSIIEFKNVFFKYPGSEIYALQNLNLKIRASEKLCIVGDNGSGKSTFIKLLTRLYYPTEGEILLDGVNINQFDHASYVKLFAPILQDYKLYYMTVKENIVLEYEKDDEKIALISNQSGLVSLIQKLSHGYDTPVYKWEAIDGFQPSGGEGQKIAITRALYRNSQILLLDEPTAALDPNAEYEIYTQFHNMITDKCAVLITHRLSAVQLADKVAVFENGRVVEYGTHKELYAKGGVYTEMFDKQAQFYRDEPKNVVDAPEMNV